MALAARQVSHVVPSNVKLLFMYPLVPQLPFSRSHTPAHSLPSSFLERCARTHTAAAAAAAGALLSFQRPLSNAIIHVYDAMTSSPSLILKVLCDLIPK